MPLQVLWFVIAGFVLGFTTSTLWEWLYYRKKRLQLLDRSQQAPMAVPRRAQVPHAAHERTPENGKHSVNGNDADAGTHSGSHSGSHSGGGSRSINYKTERRAPTASDSGSRHSSHHLDSNEKPNGFGSSRSGRRSSAPSSEWQLPVYRNTGVLLESEQPIPGSQTDTQSTPHKSTPQSTPYPEAERVTEPGLGGEQRAPIPSESAVKLSVPYSQQSEPAKSNVIVVEHRPHPSVAVTRAESQQHPELHSNSTATHLVETTTAAPEGTDSPTRDSTAADVVNGSAQAPKTPILNSADHGVVTGMTIADNADEIRRATATPNHTTANSAANVAAPSEHTQPKVRRAPDHPDNLASIKGIGEAYKRRLYATGIYTWRQLAESDTDTLLRITRAKPNADIQSWQTQARDMAVAQNRWDANFHGPLDDFTRIEGIGAVTADILYKVGVCTYEQLAATTVEELERVVPAPTVGNENDFEGWLRSATHLARAKQRNGGRLP